MLQCIPTSFDRSCRLPFPQTTAISKAAKQHLMCCPPLKPPPSPPSHLSVFAENSAQAVLIRSLWQVADKDILHAAAAAAATVAASTFAAAAALLPVAL